MGERQTKSDRSKKKQKAIAVVVIAVLLVYLLGVAAIWIFTAWLSPLLCAAGLIFPIVVSAIAIGVLHERINEIEKDEYDDLSKY